jgi:hypothetical protein
MRTLITPDMCDREILAVSDEALIANARQAVRGVKRAARAMFYGIASGAELVEVTDPVEGVEYFTGEDGVPCLWVEKVTKFPKSRGSKSKYKHHRNYNPAAHDNMIVKVGTPGSRERLDALRDQYAAIEAGKHDVSPFRDE